jgi:hypothetical protein
MADDKNTVYYSIVGVEDTIPASTTGTGTIAVTGTGVFGTGTDFKSEVQAGGWLVDFAQNEIRKIIKVNSDTSATLQESFTLDIAPSTALIFVAREDLNVRELSFYADTVDALLDGSTLQAGVAVDLGKTGNSKEHKTSFIDPVIIDATGTTVYVLILR